MPIFRFSKRYARSLALTGHRRPRDRRQFSQAHHNARAQSASVATDTPLCAERTGCHSTEDCKGTASALKGPQPAQLNPASSLPGPAPPIQQSQSQAALLGHHSTTFCAEEAVLQKMRWASQELQRSASVETCIQLCNLIRSCADSLRSLRDLKFSHF
ncbi:protein ZNRD2-like [Conger conger]|uniref:protein ZNRD2-like n=1 Tax=Conger conger TaxID=82655 RepID=UPI002A5A2B72|nr:protein ZNRD2-like [Conger conger]